MLFRAKPHYAVSLSKLVVFNSLGTFQTDDEKLIEELKKVPSVYIDVEKPKKIKIEVEKVPVVEEKTEEVKQEVDIAKLREEYKEKTGKKAFGGRDVETLQKKLAE